MTPHSSAAEANRIEEARFKAVKEEQEKKALYGRALKKRLRTRMQAHFHNTKTLPMDLFRAFQKFDKDASGFIDYSEFESVRNSPCLCQPRVAVKFSALIWISSRPEKILLLFLSYIFFIF